MTHVARVPGGEDVTPRDALDEVVGSGLVFCRGVISTSFIAAPSYFRATLITKYNKKCCLDRGSGPNSASDGFKVNKQGARTRARLNESRTNIAVFD